MKASCSGSQTGRNPLAALFPDHQRFLLCFAFLVIKKYLDDQCIPWQGIFLLSVHISVSLLLRWRGDGGALG